MVFGLTDGPEVCVALPERHLFLTNRQLIP